MKDNSTWEPGFLFSADQEKQAREQEKNGEAASTVLRNFGSPMRNI
jgi:hypothetical protein